MDACGGGGVLGVADPFRRLTEGEHKLSWRSEEK